MRSDGSVFPIELVIVRGDREGGALFLAYLRDLSERRAAEKALADSEARFRTIAESVPVGMLISEVGTGRPLFINAMAREQLGLGPDEMPETMRDNWADPADRDRLLAGLARDGAVKGFEADLAVGGRRMTALFSATRIDHGGRPALLTATVDISDLRRVQAELEASEARLSAIIAANPVAMNIARLSDRRLLFVNQPYIDTFGLEGVDLDGFDRDTLYADPAERDWIYGEIGAGREVTNVELMLRRTDGSEVPTSLTSRPILFQGEPALVTSSVDLTALRAAQAEVARSREALHQSEKLTALGALLAGVAHELNNPLSVVVGYASMLGEFDMEPAMKARIEKIHAAAERCARIVRTFLAMARARPPQRGPVALGEVIEGALELAAYGLRSADVAVELDVPEGLPPVEGDGDQLHQVVINLVVNAQQALTERPQPRRLSVRARAADRRGGGRGRRQRPRHGARGCAPGVRAVLHHEAAGRRHRGRALGLPRHRRGARRPDRGRHRAGQGRALPRPPAARGGAGRGGRAAAAAGQRRGPGARRRRRAGDRRAARGAADRRGADRRHRRQRAGGARRARGRAGRRGGQRPPDARHGRGGAGAGDRRALAAARGPGAARHRRRDRRRIERAAAGGGAADLREAARPRRARRRAPATPAPGGCRMTAPLSILVVDDEPDLRALLTDYLGLQGFAVRTAASAAELDARLAEAPADLIVLDVNMPGETGLEALARLRRQGATAGVIMLTAAGALDARLDGLGDGADDYVVKPFEPRELLARIRAVARRLDEAPAAPTPPATVRMGACRFDPQARCLRDAQAPRSR